MKWLFIIGGIGIIFIVIVAFFIVRVELNYRRQGEDDSLRIKLSILGGLIRFKRTFPVFTLNMTEPSVQMKETTTSSLSSNKSEQHRHSTLEDMMQSLNNIQFLKQNVVGLYRILQLFLANVRCQKIKWHSVIGTGDAAEAGILTGLTWNLKSVILGWGCRYIQMETEPNVRVTPDFNQLRLETHVACIAKFRLGQAMMTGCRIFFHAKKYGFRKRLQQAHTANETT